MRSNLRTWFAVCLVVVAGVLVWQFCGPPAERPRPMHAIARELASVDRKLVQLSSRTNIRGATVQVLTEQLRAGPVPGDQTCQPVFVRDLLIEELVLQMYDLRRMYEEQSYARWRLQELHDQLPATELTPRPALPFLTGGP